MDKRRKSELKLASMGIHYRKIKCHDDDLDKLKRYAETLIKKRQAG